MHLHIIHIKVIIGLVLGLALCFVVYKNRKKKKELITLFVSILISLFLAEGMIRIFFPQKMDVKSIFERDEELGWRFVPNKESWISYAELGPHHIKTNSDGFRDGEFDLKSDRKKVLVIGDSFVSNIGVKDDEVFTELMEQKTEKTSFFNLGVNGYSPLQSHYLLKEWLQKTDSKEVLFFLYTRNDFTDNTGTSWLLPRPTASIDSTSGELIINEIPKEFGEDGHRPFSLYQYSHLYVLFDRTLRRIFPNADPELPSAPELLVCSKKPIYQWNELSTILEKIIVEVQETCNEAGANLTFVIAPSIFQANEDKWDELLEILQKDPNDFDRYFPNKFLSEVFEKHNIEYIDLLPSLEKYNSLPLYNETEQHWNNLGNQVVANTLLEEWHQNKE